MIKHKDFFKIRKESENILKYTFMIDTDENIDSLKNIATDLWESTNIRNKNTENLTQIEVSRNCDKILLARWIDECFDDTHLNCNFTFPHYSSGNSFFFDKEEVLTYSKNGYSVLEGSKRFWYFILKQNAILSAYDILRKYISSLNQLDTGADFLNYLMPFGISGKIEKNNARYGLYYLLTHNAISLNDNGKISVKSFIRDDKSKKNYFRSRNSSLLEKSEDIEHILTTHFDFSKVDTIESKHPLLQLNTLEFFEYISGRKKGNNNANLKNIFLSHNKGTHFDKEIYDKYTKEYKTLVNDLLIQNIDIESTVPHIDDENLETVDKLYCRYLIEKVFGIELSDCLYKNIVKHPKKDYLAGITDFISNCFLLPNTYSRNLVLQTALDALRYNPSINKFSGKSVEERIEEFLDNCSDDLIVPYESYNSLDYYDALDEELGYYNEKDYDKEHSNVNYPDPDPTESIDEYMKRILDFKKGKFKDVIKKYTSCTPLDNISEYSIAKFYKTPFKNSTTKKEFQYTESTRTQLENQRWESNYVKFIEQVTKYIIPIYNNYFFNTMWKSMLHTCKVKSNRESDKERLCAVRLFSLLSYYLNDSNTIKTLFNNDTLFNTFNEPLSSYSSEAIIKPFEEPDEDTQIDYDLYHKCIKASALSKDNESPPDFLTIDYIAPSGINKATINEYIKFSILRKQ